jgi:hypothetical protein
MRALQVEDSSNKTSASHPLLLERKPNANHGQKEVGNCDVIDKLLESL